MGIPSNQRLQFESIFLSFERERERETKLARAKRFCEIEILMNVVNYIKALITAEKSEMLFPGFEPMAFSVCKADMRGVFICRHFLHIFCDLNSNWKSNGGNEFKSVYNLPPFSYNSVITQSYSEKNFSFYFKRSQN